MKKRIILVTPLGVFLGLICLMILTQVCFADSASSTCANTVVNGAANTCYTVTPPLLSGMITADGTETEAAWASAQTKSLAGDFTGTVKMLRDTDALYFLIIADDGGYNPSDQIRLFIDTQHNHAMTTDDIEFRIVRDTGASPNHRKITSSGDDAWTPATLGSELGRTSGAGWTAELKLTWAELGVTDFPAIMGFGIQAEDNPNNNLATWPADFNNMNPATTWANLKTRYPIEYMIVLDQSGSMLSQSKWDNAKKAVNFMANAMAILRDATYFEDKIGVVTFSWNNAANTDQTTTPKPLAPVPAFPLGNYTDALPAVSSPMPNYYTPIGKGLDAAFTALGTGVEETQRVVLFLSDGLHNRPVTDVPLQPSHLNYDPCNGVAGWGVCPAGTDHRIQVNTVALGDDTGVDTGLLTNIKNRFAGTETTYNITTNVEDLKQYFIQSLDDLYQMNLASSDPGGTEFSVNAGERKLVVILSWTTPGSATTFSLQQKVNPGDPWNNVTCDVSAVENATVGYAICIVNNPPAGTWRAVDAMGNPLASDRQFVLLDLNLRARFAIDQKVHGTGLDIILTADLNEAGVPVTHDPVNHPVKVTVTIKRPGEGFGTYVSVHTPDSCEPRPPSLPPIRRDIDLIKTGLTTGVFTTAVTQPPNIDVKPDRFAKIDTLFKLCNKDSLIFIEDPGIELYDDGTHGDVTPNDGIYTLQFLNTQYEGSYVFRFKASGISPSGSSFSRVKTLAEYVRVEVDPSQTTFDSRIYQQSGNFVFKEYYVIPRDKFSGYLGPGYPDQIQFYATGGQWASPVIDYNNGIYSRLLSYDKTQRQPDVTPVIQGKPIKPTPSGPAIPCWWVCLIIIIILLIIIAWLIIRRRRP